MSCAWKSQAAGARPDSPTVDDWEIDITQLHIEAKIASGAFSNLYKGTYCGQEVAVKILKMRWSLTNTEAKIRVKLMEKHQYQAMQVPEPRVS